MISRYFTDKTGYTTGFATDQFFSIIWSEAPIRGANPLMVLSAVIDWLEYGMEENELDEVEEKFIALLNEAHDLLEKKQTENSYVHT